MNIPYSIKWTLVFFFVAGMLPVARADETVPAATPTNVAAPPPASNGGASQPGGGQNIPASDRSAAPSTDSTAAPARPTAPAGDATPLPVEPVASGVYETGSKRLSLELGAGFPTRVNNFSDSQKMGTMGGLQYLYSVDEFWGVGVQADYFQFPAKEHAIASDAGGFVNTRSKDKVATVELVGRLTILPNAWLVPYLHSGLGVTYFRQKADGEPLPGSTWTDTNSAETRSLQDVSSVNFSYSVGLGVETNLAKNLLLGLETAWHVFGVSQTTYGTHAINVPTVSLRLGWVFGTKPAS